MDALTEIARRLENMIRLGTVAQVDHDGPRPRVRVQTGKLLTTFRPYLTLRAGKTRTWNPPTIGEDCVLFSLSGDPAQAIALVGLNSESHPAPANSPDLDRTEYPDGALIQYDHAAHILTAILPQGGKAELTAPGGVSIVGNVDIQGLVTVSDDVVAAGISLVKHPHGGVQRGSDLTEAPQ